MSRKKAKAISAKSEAGEIAQLQDFLVELKDLLARLYQQEQKKSETDIHLTNRVGSLEADVANLKADFANWNQKTSYQTDRLQEMESLSTIDNEGEVKSFADIYDRSNSRIRTTGV